MKTCPLCSVYLKPETYEGFRVFRCSQCNGHLLDITRFESIKRIPEKTLPELETEAREEFVADTAGAIRCPRCHITMFKKPIPAPGFNLHCDLCSQCHLVWLDGGELAMAQLAHQATPAFRHIQDMKRRAAELEADPERKAAFTEAVSKLPKHQDMFTEALNESIGEALYAIFTNSHTPTRL
jgi:Zn-finger nucleic acid-binding protein